jgi:DNA-binding MarR family transcriptional regulator
MNGEWNRGNNNRKSNTRKSIYDRGRLMARVIEALNTHGMYVHDMLDVLWPGSSVTGRKTREELREMYNARGERRRVTDLVNEAVRSRQRVYSLLYYLEREGLVARRRSPGVRAAFFSLTSKGKDKHKSLSGDLSWYGRIVGGYEATPSDDITLIVFDIPERDRKKRAWLRYVLEKMGFVLVQKSVWAARLIVPEQFVRDLEAIDVLKYVLIACVAKEGMIGELIPLQ